MATACKASKTRTDASSEPRSRVRGDAESCVSTTPPGTPSGCCLLPVHGGAFTLVDLATAEWLRAHGHRRLCLQSAGYVVLWLDAGVRLLHRVITHAAPGVHVHHVNGDRRDNRLANLRPLSPAEHA